jgi:serine protease Do
VTLGELSEKSEQSSSRAVSASALRGIQVENLTSQIARELGAPTGTSGVVITSVDPSSAAAAADLERGDVIQEVNRKPVRTIGQYERALVGTNGQAVLLLVNRGGSTHFIVVSPQ